MKIPTFTISFTRVLLAGLLLLSSVHAHAQSENTANESISQGQLEQILAPIALYPDTILSHILVAATYPLEVVQAERWTVRNPKLQGSQAVQAVDDQEWDPSVRALVAFPQILKRMSQDLDWTQQLGDAFLQDEKQVLASVQILRKLAEQAGSLDEMQKVSVIHEDKTIIIEPREREVVYVPYYDTRVVYGPWRWQHYNPVFWDYPYYDRHSQGSYYAHNRHSSFYWGPRVSLSFGFFFNTFHWQDRHLVRISSRHYRPSRYYSHYDILGHSNAERWVHNSGRRYGHRNRHNVNRDYRRDKYQNDRVESGQHQGAWSQGQSQQERVRNQLATAQSRVVGPSNVSQNSQANNRTENNRSNAAQTSPVQLNQPIKNSRVVMPSRASSFEEVRRSTQHNVNRELERQRPARVLQQHSGGFASQQRPATMPRSSQPAPPVTRPSPQQRQVQSTPVKSRQDNKPPRTDKPRPGPNKAQSATRRERGQLR